MSKRARVIAAVVLLVIVGGVVAALALGSRGGGPEVETATVDQKNLAVTVTASGKVEAGVQADVFPPAAGTLEEIYVRDGETVTAGTKLAQMDTGQFEVQVAQAQAALSQARAQLATVNQQATGPADVTAARAQVAATYQAYVAAQRQLAAIGNQAPTATQLAAAEAATEAARRAWENARDAYEAAKAASPLPSADPTVAALAAVRDQTYAAYLGAQASEEQLRATDLTAARAQAQAGVDQAFAAWKAAEAQLARLCNSSPAAQRAAAEAAMRQAATALKLAQQNLEDATLIAPIDGRVVFNQADAAAAAAAAAAGAGGAAGGAGGGDGAAASMAGAGGASSKLGEGAPVSPSAAPFSVFDLGALKFTAEVDEADIQRIKVGMETDVELDAFPEETFTSRVVRINPVAQPTATGGTVFEVEILLDDTGKDILIGMKGDATIRVSARDDALAIPVEALFSEGGTDYVYRVVNGTLDKTEITAGATTDTEVEVLDGLKQGDVVALSGSTQYTDGMQVRTK